MSDHDRAVLPDTLPIFPLRRPAVAAPPAAAQYLRAALSGDDPRRPPVYPIGCAGRITSFTETDDGRYLLTLTGVSRFRIRDELPLLSGYRRVVAEWQSFAHDVDTPTGAEFDRDRFIRGLKGFFTQRQISADWEAIEKAAGEHLINSIAMLCPFAPSEKQALLEAPDLDERARLLIALVEMAAVDPGQSFSAEESGATRH